MHICAKVKYSDILLCLRAQGGCAGLRGDMGRHYSARDFFRQNPKRLLARYFEGRSVLAGLDFAALKQTQPEGLFGARYGWSPACSKWEFHSRSASCADRELLSEFAEPVGQVGAKGIRKLFVVIAVDA